MVQVIRCRVLHDIHGVTILTAIVHYDLVHVSVEEFLLSPLSWSDVICGILILLNKICLLRIDIVRDLVLVKPEGTVPEVLTLSQVSNFLYWSDRVCDGFNIGISRDKLLLAHLDHHFRLVIKNFHFICVKQLIFMPSIDITFHIIALKNWV